MSTRSYEERLEDLKRRQNQLKEQEKDLRKRVATEERKKRTRRLIEIGGIVQSVLGRPLEDEDKEKLKRFLLMQERNGNYFSKAMNKGAPDTAKNDKEPDAEEGKSTYENADTDEADEDTEGDT